MSRPTITLDTNCSNTRRGMEAMNTLERLHEEGVVELVKTDVLDTENAGWEGPRGKRAREKFAALKDDMGVLVLDHSRLDHARLAGDEDAALLDAIAELVFGAPLTGLQRRQDVRDVMMLATHAQHGRDMLITADKTLLGKRGPLRDRFDILVTSPEAGLKTAQELAKTRSN